ncbi:alpha/beta fold hydrolase [Streptomyces sp. 5-6(2022)]|uniref:alpha/beta hydrolase family protein n=1 Tax=Streptomyces sp. 5-6(2022) TaxID=2936510 RepID=UPI0023B9C76F|nr:alpha/beta fold hydrolase [Streptomyces sp. 5-6(2022)]
MSSPFTESAGIPVNDPVPVSTYHPLVLNIPERVVDLQLKVSAPATGDTLPVILMSHGNGPSNFVSSLHGYGPVVNFWAAHGFVVIQPTHLDSMTLGLREADSFEAPLYWRSRVTDMHFILDHLDEIEAAVPGLSGRIDRNRIAAVGHSMGGHTVGMLCGETVTDPRDSSQAYLPDGRIKVGVMMGTPGRGADLAEYANERWPILNSTEFDKMTTPALIISGDDDWTPLFSARQDWRTDAYHLSPGSKDLLWLYGASHGFGGVSSYDANEIETPDENPERVATLRAMVWAYLRTQLDPGDTAWPDAVAALATQSKPMGHVESRP